jgi:hypothetical protein
MHAFAAVQALRHGELARGQLPAPDTPAEAAADLLRREHRRARELTWRKTRDVDPLAADAWIDVDGRCIR